MKTSKNYTIHALLLVLLLAVLGSGAFAQTIKPATVYKPNTVLDADGYYKPVSEVFKETGKYYIAKDNTKLPVYINTLNKIFVIVKSAKTGKESKRYLKL